MKKKALYAGTFDPITTVHLSIIKRAANIFSSVTIALPSCSHKPVLFDISERVDLISKSIQNLENVSVETFDGLVMDFAQKNKFDIFIRGLRNTLDLEYEIQMEAINKKLNPSIETVFLLADQEKKYVSSSAVKQIALAGGDFSFMVPECVYEQILNKVNSL